jgi:hypothetical protein
MELYNPDYMKKKLKNKLCGIRISTMSHASFILLSNLLTVSVPPGIDYSRNTSCVLT